MARTSIPTTLVLAIGIVAITTGIAPAQNLLTNGDFPAPVVSTGIPGWSLVETVTGMPGAPVNSAQQQDFANQPGSMTGEFGLWLLGFAGNTGDYNMQNKMINAILSQETPATAGEKYTFTGWSRFEQNFAGGVDFLDPTSPSGDIASPTETTMLLEFLDSGGSVLGAPVTLDIKADRLAQSDILFPNDNIWYQHMLMGTAPTGTARARVTAQATDMVFNLEPQQSAMYDNFSLVGASATELLTNPNLNEQPPVPPEFDGWTVTELPEGTDTVAEAGFANHPGSTGANGAWLRGFANGDAILSQTVPGTPGGEYAFSLWSAWEQNYSGGTPATTTENFMTLEFLDANEEVLGTPIMLDLADAGQTNSPGPIGQNPQAWQQFSVEGTAPANTAFVKVSAGAIGMFNTMMNPQSAFLDDFVLTLATAGLPGDYNNDGSVDAADYVVWRKNDGTPDGYETWRENFGRTAGAGSGNLLAASAAVPEPTGLLLGIVALAGAAACRRYGRKM